MRHKDSNKKQEYQVAARYSLVRILIWLDYQKTSHLLQGFLCLPHLRQRGQPINRSESDIGKQNLGRAIIAYDANITKKVTHPEHVSLILNNFLGAEKTNPN
jgi:hypothetical protein